MASTEWLDEFFATNNPACDRILLRAVTEFFLNSGQGQSGLDWGPRLEHRCYELLNAALSASEAVAAPPSSSGAPYRESAALTCVRCGRTIAKSESNITERGAVCDGCFAAG